MGTTHGTPYEILQVSKNANTNELRHAFLNHIHALKQRKISDIAFRHICRAYECLSDLDKRKNYDDNNIWTFQIPIKKYTLQQLASEPSLILELKNRLNNATLQEINAQDPITSHTILYRAARVGNILAVLYLIEKGAEPDLFQNNKSTALHVSSFYGHPEVVRCLLESGADYRIKNAYGNLAESEAYNNDVQQTFIELKQTPFVQAAANQLNWFKDNINNLCHHIDQQYYIHRQTLLQCASKKGYLDLVCWLVEERSANLDIVDINLNSALHLAAHNGHLLVVEYLLNRGANSLLVNKWNMTAEQDGKHHGISMIDIFKSIRQRNVFEMALNGIDWWFKYHFSNNSPDAVDENGISLLYFACRYGQISVAKWLLEHGANVNIQSEQGTKSTPLHAAAFFGHGSVVELLLERGADVNIKNNFGATVFDEDKPDNIKIILQQYRRNFNSDKLMPVHIYMESSNDNEPIVKTYLRFDAKKTDLLEALPEKLRNENGYFAIAKRPLHFETDDTPILTAVCLARYVRSIFVEIPLRLTFSTGKIHMKNTNRLKKGSTFDYATFERTFETKSRSETLTFQSSNNTKQICRIDNLLFSISSNSNDTDVEFNVQYKNVSNSRWCGLPGCVYLFKITYESRSRLKELPIVSFSKEPNVRLYTLVPSSPYWFTCDTCQKRLPIIESIHAFFHYIDIIPALLSLPADLFISIALEQPLILSNNPVPCKYLELRKRDNNKFPLIAYHGTRINAVQSILMDGIVIPGTIVANGTRISPPPNHIPLYINVNNISNFANAIFLSPSIYYSSDTVYATPFEHEGQLLLPVLECSVKAGSYTTHKSTVPNYNPHPTDNMNMIEWRINDPTSIEINRILFIIKEFDRRKKA